MCAIGRGLMARPRLLMLDEPSLGLAPVMVKPIFEILARINAEGMTILLVEQNVLRSLQLSHRGYVIENGRITIEGTGADLLSEPPHQAGVPRRIMLHPGSGTRARPGDAPGRRTIMTSPIITEAVRDARRPRRTSRGSRRRRRWRRSCPGAATNAQIAAFLTALRMKGETVEELIGFAQVMRQKVVKVKTRGADMLAQTGTDREMLIDTCGTGGDASGTFNVSTATAFVVAGAGLSVAKHGNRSVSSLCGSADVAETLGISVELSPVKVARCVDEVGIGFLYAPLLHTAMKHVMAARREMGIRTVFNMLGPLTNPAGANAQVIGVYAASLTEPLARVLAELGTLRAFVVHGADGLDEISNTGESLVSEVHEGVVRSSRVRPEDFGLAARGSATCGAGTGRRTPSIIRRVLAGDPGPRRDIVLMNTAAALVVGAQGAGPQGGGGAGRAIDRFRRGGGEARRAHRPLPVASPPRLSPPERSLESASRAPGAAPR